MHRQGDSRTSAPASCDIKGNCVETGALRAAVIEQRARPDISPRANRVECFFNKVKLFRRIATRYDELAENYLAALKLVSIRILLRGNKSTL